MFDRLEAHELFVPIQTADALHQDAGPSPVRGECLQNSFQMLRWHRRFYLAAINELELEGHVILIGFGY